MQGFWSLPRGARHFIVGLSLLAVLQTGLFVQSVLQQQYRGAIEPQLVPIVVAVFSVLALVAGVKPISMPAGDQKSVVSSVLVASILLVGPEYATIPAIVQVVGHHLIRHRPAYRLPFNLSQYVVTVGLSGSLYHLLRVAFGLQPATPPPAGFGRDALTFGSVESVVALAIFLISYFVLNTGLVATVMALTQETPVATAYRQSTASVVAHFLDTLVVGVIAAMLWMLNPWTVALVGVLVFFIYNSYSIAASLDVARRDLLKRMTELQRRTAELELVNQVNTTLTRAVDLPGLWEMLADQVGRILDASCFIIALVDARDEVRIAYGQDEGVLVTDEVLPQGPGLTRWIVEQSRPLLIHDYANEAEAFPKPVVWGSGRMPESLLAVPMVVDGRVLGAICAQSYRQNAYTQDDLQLLSAIAGQAAVAIHNAQLQKESAEARAMHQLDLLKTQFISTVSHELRSPLTPIVGYSEILTMDGYGPDEIKDMAGEINRAAVHMQLLVDDLLDLSRIEAGRLRLQPQETQLDELLRDAVRGLVSVSSKHQIRVEVPEHLPVILADRVRVRQVIDNLVSNAIKYSPDGGAVTLLATAHEGTVRVSVSDQGPGIATDKQSRLFEAFYRVEGELTRRIRGTGLGLAICRHLVELHGGRIWVESQVGRGSTFTFTLPVAPPEGSADNVVEPVFSGRGSA
jgi:signal transduction histidine kinase